MTPQKYTPAVKVAERLRLDFKPLTIDALPEILPLLDRAGTRSCDFTVGGLLMWVDYFGYEYCVEEGTLFIRGLSEDPSRRPAFSLPVGEMPLSDAVDAIVAYCRDNGQEPLFSAIPEERLPELLACGRTQVYELSDWADYIYRASDLANLPGKAYNKKRNHVNRFVSDNPGWRLEPLTDDNVGEVAEFFEALGIESEKADPAMAEFEREQCADVLRHWDSYPFEGALLRGDGGSIVAFTFGEMKGDTLVLHVEKMLHGVSGAGEAINSFFARHMMESHPELRYINREDDSGDPGLRFAKESYHPDYKLKKYNVLFI